MFVKAGAEKDDYARGRVEGQGGEGDAQDARGGGSAPHVPPDVEAERERLVVLGRLAGVVAHEINGCLAALGLQLAEIEAIARTLRDPGPGDRGAQFRERIEGANECVLRISDLVGELRRFGRPETAPLELVRLDDVALAAFRMTAPLLGRTARVELSLEGPAAVKGRRGWLVQVAVNLLRNSADALADTRRPRDASRILLSTRTEGGFAILSVEDNGPGIAAELRARLPEPYLTTKPPAEGSGLGLSISERIVRDLGGALRIESGPGDGTRVEMRLPIADP